VLLDLLDVVVLLDGMEGCAHAVPHLGSGKGSGGSSYGSSGDGSARRRNAFGFELVVMPCVLGFDLCLRLCMRGLRDCGGGE
jgi:hypothetical protein